MDQVKIPAPTNGQPLSTPRLGWRQLLTVGAETDSSAPAIPTTTDDVLFTTYIKSPTYAHDTNGVFDIYHQFGDDCNGVEIQFYGQGAADQTAGIQLFAFRDQQLAADGVNYNVGKLVYYTEAGLLLGARDLDLDPYTGATLTAGFWCDTLSGTDNWGVDIQGSGNNDIMSLLFDTRGYKYLLINSEGVGDTGDEADALGAIISGY